MKKLIFTILAILFSQTNSFSEDIHFDNETYKLKFSALAPSTNGYGNEYYKQSENASNWTKMIGIYYYPEENSPIEYSQEFSDIIDETDNSLLLKLVENKKTNQAVISFLVNGEENSQKFFEYDAYKFEKHPTKGIVVSKYAARYNFSNDAEINQIAKSIKQNNDKYLELLIISGMPSVVEKDISI